MTSSQLYAFSYVFWIVLMLLFRYSSKIAMRHDPEKFRDWRGVVVGMEIALLLSFGSIGLFWMLRFVQWLVSGDFSVSFSISGDG